MHIHIKNHWEWDARQLLGRLVAGTILFFIYNWINKVIG